MIGSAFQTPIEISSKPHGHTCTLYRAFVKYQSEIIFGVAPSNQLSYVPHLNEAFHVTKNTLFRIVFQGLLHSPRPGHAFAQIMVNDYLIIGDRLFPNTVQRLAMAWNTPGFMPDGYGGYIAGGNPQHDPITRIAMVYLPPGTYTFNVGVRAVTEGTGVAGGLVTYELTQFDHNNTDLGDFQLATLP